MKKIYKDFIGKKMTYRGFAIGETHIVQINGIHEDAKTVQFVIEKFVPSTIIGKYDYFIKGKTESGEIVRLFPNEICKLKQL